MRRQAGPNSFERMVSVFGELVHDSMKKNV